MKYLVIEALDKKNLVEKVNNALADGWFLHGQPIIFSRGEQLICFYQAMVMIASDRVEER